jgi:hypothetical protein
LGGVAKYRGIPVDHVAVAAPVALPFDVPGFDEIRQDPPRGSERDPDLIGDIAQANSGSRAMQSKTCGGW